MHQIDRVYSVPKCWLHMDVAWVVKVGVTEKMKSEQTPDSCEGFDEAESELEGLLE